MKIGCLNKNTNITEYVYEFHRFKNLEKPYGAEPYVQYVIDINYPLEQYIWDPNTQQVILDPNYEPPVIPPDPNITGNSGYAANFQFALSGTMNYDQYLISTVDGDTNLNRMKRSGDTSNGYKWGNCSPLIIPFTGKLVHSSIALKGAATSTSSPNPEISVSFEIWKVGFDNEGTKLSDLVYTIDTTTNTVGNWWNNSVNTNYTNYNHLDIDVNAGDMIALKFISNSGSANAKSIRGTLVSLILVSDNGE